MRNRITLVFVAFFVTVYSNVGKCEARDIIYEEAMPDKQTLVVERHEAPYVEPPEMKDYEAHLPPGETVELPKYTYTYTYTLLSKNRKHNVILWEDHAGSTERIPPGPAPIQRGDPHDTNVIILKATVQGDALILVYKLGSDDVANIILPDGKGGRKALPWPVPSVWGDPIDIDTYIQGADITGSLKKHTLKITLMDQHGGKYPFLFQNAKWVKQFRMHPNADKTQFTPGP